MHNLYLGLLQRHCHEIWGMNIKHEDGDGTTNLKGSVPSVPSLEAMQARQAALNSGSHSKLMACTRSVLWYLCEEHDLRCAGTKKQLTGYLLQWVSLVPFCSTSLLKKLMVDVYSSKRAVSVHGLDPSPYVGPTPPSSQRISVTQVSYAEQCHGS